MSAYRSKAYPLNSHRGNVMLIKKHDKSRIVELEDGSLWRIWPGDIALTLNWLPTTDLRVSEIADEFCSHALTVEPGGNPHPDYQPLAYKHLRRSAADCPVAVIPTHWWGKSDIGENG